MKASSMRGHWDDPLRDDPRFPDLLRRMNLEPRSADEIYRTGLRDLVHLSRRVSVSFEVARSDGG